MLFYNNIVVLFVPALARLRAVGGGVVGPADDKDDNLEDHGDHDDIYIMMKWLCVCV